MATGSLKGHLTCLRRQSKIDGFSQTKTTRNTPKWLTNRGKNSILCALSGVDWRIRPAHPMNEHIRIRSNILANSAQARKRARQAETSRQLNAGQRADFRTALKKVVYAIEEGDKSKATEMYKAAIPVIDKVSGKGLISANKSARHKSRLNARIKSL
jgi:small subunit ribosomal protein S20